MITPQARSAREVAGKLTKAQRAWLLAAKATLDEVPKTPCAKWWDNPPRLYVTIDGTDYWLGSKHMCSPAGTPAFTEGSERLYPLGLAVREAILADRSER